MLIRYMPPKRLTTNGVIKSPIMRGILIDQAKVFSRSSSPRTYFMK